MKRVATGKQQAIVGIEHVVGMNVVRVEPELTIVEIHVEHVGIAIGVRNVYHAICATAL
ncbi:MAG: hypothetical protein Q8P11_00990 [bacterium]|nr:hypothetical protein [bacterium]